MENSKNCSNVFETRKPQFLIEQILRKEHVESRESLLKESFQNIVKRQSNNDIDNEMCLSEQTKYPPIHYRSKSVPETNKLELVGTSNSCSLCRQGNVLRCQESRSLYHRSRLSVPLPIYLPRERSYSNIKTNEHYGYQRNHPLTKRNNYNYTDSPVNCDICEIPMPPLIRHPGRIPPLIRPDTRNSIYDIARYNHKPNIFPLNIFRSNEYQYQNQQRNVQVRFTSNQSKQLEKAFETHKYISNEQRKELSKDLCLSERQVKTWFQNRRAKWRKIKLDNKISENNTNDQMPLFKYLCN